MRPHPGAMDQGDDPSAADMPKPVDDEGPRVDPAEPFRWALASSRRCSFVERRFVDDFLANVLPLAFELSGRYEGATEGAMLNEGHPQRAYLVGATGAVAVAVLAVTGVIFWALLIRSLALTRRVGKPLLRTVASFVVAVLWRPRWWGTFPSSSASRRSVTRLPCEPLATAYLRVDRGGWMVGRSGRRACLRRHRRLCPCVLDIVSHLPPIESLSHVLLIMVDTGTL